MSTEVRIQHYVPRLYLRSFCAHDKKREYLYCLDKASLKRFKTSIASVGVERDFFAARDDFTKSLEARFGRLESVFGNCYRRLIKTRTLGCLSSDDKMIISYYVAAQELRTKEFRQMLGDMVRQLREHLSKEKMSEELERQLNKAMSNESIEGLHTSMLGDIPQFAETYGTMKWVLFKSRTSMSYWTSDHPVVRYNPVDLRPYGNMGLMNRGIQIYFPLTTRLILSFCDPELYAQIPSENNVTDPENVVFQNWLQVACSTRHVFSRDGDFSLAERIIRENPSLGSIDRQRVSVD